MVAAAIVGGAVIGAGASIYGSSQQADAAGDAAAIQAAATASATAEERRQFDLTRADFAPYRETGTNALAQFAAITGIDREGVLSPEEIEQAREHFIETPGYKFRFEEGVRALDRSAAAKGKLRGGGHERELIRFGQGIASEEFGTYSNRLAALAGIGQDATRSSAYLGQQSTGNITNLLTTGAARQGSYVADVGTARASGTVGAGNQINAGIQNMLAYRASQPQPGYGYANTGQPYPVTY